MYNYIPHPSNSRISSQVLALRIEEGAAGYGIYWMILELLRDAPNYKFSASPKALSFAINESDSATVERVVRNYGLFDFDDSGLMFSPWLLEAMEAYSDKKAKLQEAGRRGAAKRWAAAHGTDGQAIATPSVEDGQAIAYNTTQHNITQDNVTLPNLTESPKVGVEYLELLCSTQPEGHAPGYVAQVCMQYGMTEATCNFVCERSDNANVSHPIFIKFKTIVGRIQREKWTPKHPDSFFLKKLFE